MIQQLCYSEIMNVTETWERARQIYGCNEKLGKEILLRMFERNHQTMEIFGLSTNVQDIRTNSRLQMGLLIHGSNFVGMLDGMFNLLGPDVDTLEQCISGLGIRHRKYGVQPSHFDDLNQVLYKLLHEILRDQWTREVQESWKTVMSSLSLEIMWAMAES
jgi:hemoglobin-like flavoprotein